MDERISRSLDHIEEHLHESLKLEDLARVACLSPSQFHRLFKLETGSTPFKFIEALKLKKAYHILLEGNATVQQLAVDLGYNDYETFSRAFKRTYNFSPDDFQSIFAKLDETYQVRKMDGIVLATVETDNEDELLAKLQEIVVQYGIDKDDLRASKIFQILKKSDNSNENHLFVKNKYEIKEGEKIWKSLIR